MSGSDMTWDEIINLEQALTNCHIDIIRDWYYDPWGWPELDWVAKGKRIAFARCRGRVFA